jgi:hypothetical protein
MRKIREGIEIPIIPEDFIASEEDLSPDMLESFLRWIDYCIQKGQDPEDGAITDMFSNLCPR